MVVEGVPKGVTTIEGSPKVVIVDEEKKQHKLKEMRERDTAKRAKKAEGRLVKIPTNTSEEVEGHATGKRPRDDEQSYRLLTWTLHRSYRSVWRSNSQRLLRIQSLLRFGGRRRR